MMGAASSRESSCDICAARAAIASQSSPAAEARDDGLELSDPPLSFRLRS